MPGHTPRWSWRPRAAVAGAATALTLGALSLPVADAPDVQQPTPTLRVEGDGAGMAEGDGQ